MVVKVVQVIERDKKLEEMQRDQSAKEDKGGGEEIPERKYRDFFFQRVQASVLNRFDEVRHLFRLFDRYTS